MIDISEAGKNALTFAGGIGLLTLMVKIPNDYVALSVVGGVTAGALKFLSIDRAFYGYSGFVVSAGCVIAWKSFA